MRLMRKVFFTTKRHEPSPRQSVGGDERKPGIEGVERERGWRRCSEAAEVSRWRDGDTPEPDLLARRQQQALAAVDLVDVAALEGEAHVAALEPGLDAVGVVRAGRVAGLARTVDPDHRL